MPRPKRRVATNGASCVRITLAVASGNPSNHPFPGTYPVVVTGEADWGGWRVPGAEYALSPARIELQARLVAGAPQMAAILKELTDWAKTCAGDVPQAMMGALKKAKDVLAYAEDASEP